VRFILTTSYRSLLTERYAALREGDTDGHSRQKKEFVESELANPRSAKLWAPTDL